MCMFFSISAFAETIVLKSGKTIEGKVLEKTDKYVKVDLKGESQYFFFSEVESIDGAPVNISNKSAQTSIVDKVDIAAESSVEDILKKADYYYSIKDFDKAIQLCETALKKTDDPDLIAKINLSLGSSYLEKGKAAYNNNKDESLLKLSIQCAKKYLENDPYSARALYIIAFAYFEMQDWKQTVFYFSEAEKFADPSNTEYLATIENSRKIAEENMRAQQ